MSHLTAGGRSLRIIMYACIYIYIYICICISYTYIYIYIERERDLYIYIYIYKCQTMLESNPLNSIMLVRRLIVKMYMTCICIYLSISLSLSLYVQGLAVTSHFRCWECRLSRQARAAATGRMSTFRKEGCANYQNHHCVFGV